MTSEEMGKSSPPKSNYKAGKKKRMKTAIFSTLKIDQKHVIICEVVVLEQLLEFSNNSGNLWYPYQEMFPFPSPPSSPISTEVLLGGGTSSFAATKKALT